MCKTKPKHPITSNISTQNSLPTVIVQLTNQLNTKALLDSGASKNFISKNLFTLLKNLKLIKKQKEYTHKIYAANDTNIKILCECLIKIKINKFTWQEIFLVIDHEHYDMILGIEFMRTKGAILNFQTHTLKFKFSKNHSTPLYLEKSQEDKLNHINIGTPEMEGEIQKLISKYPSVFTDKIGEAIDLKIKLKLKDQTPVNLRPYYLSPPALQKAKNIIQDWLDQDIIEPSLSEYSSPAFLTKQDRLVVNYTELNKKLEKMNYPLGDAQNLYQHLRNGKYYTIIDLNKAFLQCPIEENSRDYTSFSLIFGKFRFKRVAFGLQIGSSILSAYLDKIFFDIKYKYLINFCDDIVIYSSSKEEHLKHLHEVIKRLALHKLTVNVQKVKFFCTEISFLGHIIKDNTITIDQSRVSAIDKYPSPKSIKEVKRFTGMTGYWSKYIPNYATLCYPLNALKRKGVKFKWSQECEDSFIKLKRAISNPPILQIADFSKEFILKCDASGIALAGVLLQENNQGDLLPIAYHSRKFTPAEQKYSIYEKECLSVITCIEKWHQFLEVQPFTLYTDNKSLSYVLESKRKLNRLSRWNERLLDLPFKTIHCSSRENHLADALTRLYNEEERNEEIQDQDKNTKLNEQIKIMQISKHNTPLENKSTFNSQKNEDHHLNVITEIPLAFKDLIQAQDEDPDCLKIKESIKKNTNNQAFYLKNDMLMYNNGSGKPKIYLPDKNINIAFAFFHQSIQGGHFGTLRTLQKIKDNFYNPKLDQIVKVKVQTCKICQMSKHAQRKYEGKLVSTPVYKAMENLFIDLVGPLVFSRQNQKYLLVCVDSFTRYVWLYPLRDCTSKAIIQKLELIFANFGPPIRIISDNASYFISNTFKLFLFKNYIEHRRIAPYRANGNKSERFIRDVTTLLRCFYQNDQRNWDQDLGNIQISLNTAYNTATKSTAFKLMFLHECNNGLSNLWKVQDFISQQNTREEKEDLLKRAMLNVKKNIASNRRRLRYHPSKTQHPFKLQDLVLVKTHFLSKKGDYFSKKLSRKFSEPHKIVYFLSPVTTLVQKLDDLSQIKKVHICDLKPYYNSNV